MGSQLRECWQGIVVSELLRQINEHVSAFQEAAGNRKTCISYARITVNMLFDHKGTYCCCEVKHNRNKVKVF